MAATVLASRQVPVGGTSALTLTTVEKDLGSLPRTNGTFDITGLSGLVVNAPVLVIMAAGPYTNKGTLVDEAEMDHISFSAYAFDSTTIRVYWKSRDYISGNIKVSYSVSGGTGIINDTLILAEKTTPPTTTASAATLYNQLFAGRPMVSQVASTGYRYMYQQSLMRNKTGYLFYQFGTAGNQGWGVTPSVSSDAPNTVINPASTNIFTATQRAGWRTATTAGSSLNLYGIGGANSGKWFLGSSAGMGGFTWSFSVGIAHPAAVANARAFVGLGQPVVIGNVEPSTVLNMIGFGFDAGETTWKVMCNDGSGAATKTDLGANFPSNTLATDWYIFTIYAPSGQSSIIYYEALNTSTGNVARGSLSSNLPTVNFFMNYQLWINNGSTALAAQLDIGQLSFETEN